MPGITVRIIDMKSAHISNLFFLILCILPSLTLLIIYGYRYWYTFSLTLSSTRCKLNFSNIAYLYTILEYGANSYIFCLIRQIASIKHNSRSPSLSHKKSTSDFSQWNKFEVLIFLLPLAGLEQARGEPLDFQFYKPFRSIWNILVLNGTEKQAQTA